LAWAEEASFKEARVTLCDFRGSRLARANFQGASLVSPAADTRTDLRGTTFTGARFRSGYGTQTPFKTRTDFRGTTFIGARFTSDYAAQYPFMKQMSKDQKGEIIKDSGCFIATACYGDPECHEVRTLRRFRDEHLLISWLGRVAMRAYYFLSPSMAETIQKHPRVRRITREWLVAPLARLAEREHNRNSG
jgi:Pentapeptide repeats (8 copies)